MELFKWALLALNTLPPAYVDKHEVGREARMGTIAGAVTEVAERASCSGAYAGTGCVRIWNGTSQELVALLLTKGWWESRVAKHVHEGRCKPDECDAIVFKGVVVQRARSPWQRQRTAYSAPEWNTMVGTSYVATRAAAWAATKVLVEGRRRCGGTSFGTLSWYGRQRCVWDGALNRNETYKKLMKVGGHDAGEQ